MKTRRLLALVIVCAVIGCKDKIVDPPPTNTLNVRFERGFLHDSVSVLLDGNVIFTASVTTNQDAGLASSFITHPVAGRHTLSVLAPGTSARVDSSVIFSGLTLYANVSYSKVNGKLYLQVSPEAPANRRRVYKQKIFFSSYRSVSAQTATQPF